MCWGEQVSQQLSSQRPLCRRIPHQSPWSHFNQTQNTSSASTRCFLETLHPRPSSMLARVNSHNETIFNLCLEKLDQYYRDRLCVHVFACFSASWGSAATLSRDGVRGQRAGAVERCQWCEGLQSGLGSNYRSAGSLWCCALYAYASCSIVCVFMIQKGSKVETVELASDSESHTLSSLQPNTEYIVTVYPLYEGKAEGPAATARFRIGILFFIPAIWAKSRLTKLRQMMAKVFLRFSVCGTCQGPLHTHYAHLPSLYGVNSVEPILLSWRLRNEQRKPELWEISVNMPSLDFNYLTETIKHFVI